jgi:hypothetical protein
VWSFFKSVAASLWLAVAVIFAGVFVIEERDHEYDYVNLMYGLTGFLTQ